MEEKGMSVCKKRRRRRNYAIKCYYICFFLKNSTGTAYYNESQFRR